MIRSGHVAAIIIAALCIASAVSAQMEMTVEDAIRVGLENNYNIRIARNTDEIAQNNRGRGTAAFLPVISSDNDFRYDTSSERTGSPLSFGNNDSRSWASHIRLTWTLFDGFRMFADKRRFNELALQGAYQSRDVIENTVVSIMRAFFNLVQQEQLIEVAESTRDISKTRLEREQVSCELGGASKTDLLNARVNFNNDQSALLDRQLEDIIARKDLNVLLARDPGEPIAVKKIIPIPDFSFGFEELLTAAKNNNSTLLTARQSNRVALQNVRIARSAFWPRIDLSGQYGYNDRAAFGSRTGPGLDRNRHNIDAGVGVVMTFNIFNGNLDRINYDNARLEALNTELNVREIENNIAGLVREKYNTFVKRIEKVHLEEQNTLTANQNMELQQERYATGISDSLDFRDAQVNLASARTRLIVARYQARISILELQQLTGRISIDAEQEPLSTTP